MTIFRAQFTTGQVVAASGVLMSTVQSWLKRGFVIGHEAEGAESDATITGGGGHGLHRRFSFHNVMEIAVAKALQDAGLYSLKDAFSAAAQFAHTGRAPIAAGDRLRFPSLPFDVAGISGKTLLAAGGDWHEVLLWRPGHDLLPEILLARDTEGVVLLDVERVFDRVVRSLGYEPDAVRAAAYQRVK